MQRNILVVIVLIMLLGLAALTGYRPNQATPSEQLVVSSTPSGVVVDASVLSQSAPAPEGYVKYENTRYGFSFYHLPDSAVREYDEGQGAMTIVLQNEKLVRGMQVFVVPYAESLITEERFKADVPSGVREDAEDTTLNGVRAVTFVSEDMLLGPTREIWIIRNGYLYEITTFKGVGNWFTPVIQSWRWLL